jgi:hypothetical protein
MIFRLLPALALGLTLLARAHGKDNEIPTAAQSVLDKATEFELLSLDPAPVEASEGKDLFHGYKILGKTVVKGDLVGKIRAALEKGVKDSDGSVTDCFNPRHGIRIVHEKKTYDFVLCYQCLSARVYVDDVKIGGFLTGNSPEPVLTKILREAKVALPERP